MHFFVHPEAKCESTNVGDGTHIGSQSCVETGAAIGAHCHLSSASFICDGSQLGDRVTIGTGVRIEVPAIIEDGVTLESGVALARFFPSSDVEVEAREPIRIRQNVWVGAGAFLSQGITVGRDAVIGAGSVVLHDVPAHAIVVGNPGQIQGYGGSQTDGQAYPLRYDAELEAMRLPGGARFVEVLGVKDLRGRLSAIEFSDAFPWAPRRFFIVHDVPSQKVRGEHAHKECQQLLIALSGAVTVLLDDGQSRQEVRLDDPGSALLIPAMLWASQYQFSPDAALGVLASHLYDPEDYIRDYEQYLSMRRTVSP